MKSKDLRFNYRLYKQTYKSCAKYNITNLNKMNNIKKK